jgi:hypothetical protein
MLFFPVLQAVPVHSQPFSRSQRNAAVNSFRQDWRCLGRDTETSTGIVFPTIEARRNSLSLFDAVQKCLNATQLVRVASLSRAR